MSALRQGLAVLAAAAAILGLNTGSASADEEWATDPLPTVCSQDIDPVCSHGTGTGYIKWSNRSALIKGEVWDDDFDTHTWTTVYFEAYAGATKVDSDTRTAHSETRRYGEFALGDPDRVGGFDRVKITVCHHFPLDWPYQECTNPPVNVYRD